MRGGGWRAAYFAERGRPTVPEELTRHECIRYRFPTSGAIYRWGFVRGVTVNAPGGVVVDDGTLAIARAGAGPGLVYTADLVVGAELAAGRLERLLEPFLPTMPGFFLYFPTRDQTQPKLRAFINLAVAMLRRSLATGRTASVGRSVAATGRPADDTIIID